MIQNKFFTDYQTQISNYCLCNIKFFEKTLKLNKKEVMIDPSVYELKENIEYSNIEKLYKIASEGKYYISIDYPNDMNLKYSDLFIQKTNENIKKFWKNEKYIIGLQYYFEDFNSFITQFYNNSIYMKNRIVGLGNLCRIKFPNSYTDKVFKFISETEIRHKIKRFHFYGLGLALIKKYLKNTDYCWSIDSTKWTHAVNNEFKYQNGVCCRKNNRDKFFLAYIEEIRKTGIEIDY